MKESLNDFVSYSAPCCGTLLLSPHSRESQAKALHLSSLVGLAASREFAADIAERRLDQTALVIESLARPLATRSRVCMPAGLGCHPAPWAPLSIDVGSVISLERPA